MMTLEEFARQAISVPFVDLGRDWSGWDCWGMCRLHHREVLGIELPSFDVGYVTAGGTAADCEAIDALITDGRVAWRAVTEPRVNDVLLMRCFGRPIHVGVLINNRQFLHAEKRLGTVIERMTSPIWSRRIEGVYRYAA